MHKDQKKIAGLQYVDYHGIEGSKLLFGNRVKLIREELGLKGSEFGDRLGLTKQQISFIETDARNLTAEHIQKIVTEFSVDPRWFFGLIENVPDAIFENQHDGRETLTEILSKKIDQQSALLEELKVGMVVPKPEEDKIAHRVAINLKLREVVEKIAFLDASMLEKIDTLVYGYLMGKKDGIAEVKQSDADLNAEELREGELVAG